MDEQPKETSKIYFYISIALSAASAIAFGLIFTPLALYSLLASIILSIAALSMAVTQKKKNNFRAVNYLLRSRRGNCFIYRRTYLLRISIKTREKSIIIYDGQDMQRSA